MKKASFSYSELSSALSCNRMYQYLYIDKLQVEEPESLALHFGSALHAGLNAILEGSAGGAFAAYWDSVAAMEFNKDRHSHESLGEMGQLFLERFYRLHKPHYELIHGEDRLYANSPRGVKLEGTPDALVMYKGKLTLVDFKTSSQRYADGKVESSDQLRLYAYLLQENLNVKIEQIAYVVFIKTKEPSIQMQVMELDQEDLKLRIANIETLCLEIAAKNEYPQNFNSCLNYGRKCKFFDKCHPVKS